MFRKILNAILVGTAAAVLTSAAFAQDSTKRNDRPQQKASPTPAKDENQKQPDGTKYSYEFTQKDFLISHIVIEHDSVGRGTISFEQKNENTPIVEPIEVSSMAQGRIFGLWHDLKFLDSDENYQAAKNFAHLGTYRLGMDDGKRKRTAEFNWSDNKIAWNLAGEYRRLADQAILVFNIKIAREMQPLNAPQLMNEMDTLITRNGLSDPSQLVPLLTELSTDEHIPLIARNHAGRILKKLEKSN